MEVPLPSTGAVFTFTVTSLPFRSTISSTWAPSQTASAHAFASRTAAGTLAIRATHSHLHNHWRPDGPRSPPPASVRPFSTGGRPPHRHSASYSCFEHVTHAPHTHTSHTQLTQGAVRCVNVPPF